MTTTPRPTVHTGPSRYVRLSITLQVPVAEAAITERDSFARGMAVAIVTGAIAEHVQKVHGGRLLDPTVERVRASRQGASRPRVATPPSP